MPEPIRIDIRQLGGGIDKNEEDNAIKANAHVAYFAGIAPADGYEYPQYGSAVCNVPYILLKDYDGELTEDMIRGYVTKHMSAGEYPIIRLCGVIPTFISITPQSGCITLRWYREDPDYSFNIYWSYYKDKEFSLYTTVSGASYGDNSLQICGLTSLVIYYFYITAVSPTGIESPSSMVMGAKVI